VSRENLKPPQAQGKEQAMKLKSLITLTAALALAAGGCAKEMFITVAISENGTAKVTETIAVDRKLVEQQLAMRDRMERGGEEEESEEMAPTPAPVPTPTPAPAATPAAPAPSAPAPAPADAQSRQDAALAAKVRDMMESDPPMRGAEGVDFKVESVSYLNWSLSHGNSNTRPSLPL
jgi:hypothetical protein